MVTIMLAIVGSFVSHASQKNPKAIVPGYVTTNPARPCAIITYCCDTPGNPVCTITIGSIIYQAFGKIGPSVPPCPVVLYRCPV